MDLSPDDKARIEAEERYRQQIRQGLSTASPPSDSNRTIVIGAVGGCVAVLAIVLAYHQGKSSRDGSGIEPPPKSTAVSTSPPATVPPPRAPVITFVDESKSVTSGQIIVKAGQVVFYRFRVEPEMYDARLIGRYTASGGSGNDVLAALFSNEDEYRNWVNGHQASVVWSSGGPKTVASCDRSLRTGEYVLAFSNKHSVVSEKQVFTGFDVRYRRKVVTE